MKLRFSTSELERLWSDAAYAGSFDGKGVSAFRARIQLIEDAEDERAFYSMKSLHFEKLKGKRDGQHSMRINDQYRLIVELEGKGPDKTVVIVEITDYH
ncbi:MAG: type II toxin-antitoxin system RelE/ParE family toxin [Acidobacteriia bacterium]|nr:type II toxin-antitoxin system RelE/ParE family toxin [Terriglobia bacterium]